MLVQDKMTKNPYCVSEDSKISKVLDIMKDKNFHRMPVVYGDKLVGLITEGTIAEHSPSKATSLSIHEMNYILSKTNVSDIMVKDVITIDAKKQVVEAAVLMRKHDIGCLVVLHQDKVVGIITQNDIFDSFIDILGYYQEGTTFRIMIEKDVPGVFANISNLFYKENASIKSIAVYHYDGIIEVVIVATLVDKESMKTILKENNFDVL